MECRLYFFDSSWHIASNSFSPNKQTLNRMLSADEDRWNNEGGVMKPDDEEIPIVTQMKSLLSYTLNPFTKSLLGYVDIFFAGAMVEMNRESFFDERAWTHEFTEIALAKMMYGLCDGSYLLCRCDMDCRVPISWLGDDFEIQLPICHFVSSLITSCNLPNKTGYEVVDGDRLWNAALQHKPESRNTDQAGHQAH